MISPRLWAPWDLKRNNKRLIEKLLNEFNKNDIWSVDRDVFMIRLADNWKEQILPHAWPGPVSQSSLWLSVFPCQETSKMCFSLDQKALQECFGVDFKNAFKFLKK